MTVFGTRPEAIKMAPLALELKKYDNIESIVCVTAQHRQMLDQVLEIFGITPDYDLDIMKTRQSLIGITTRVLEGLDEVIKKEQPDIVLVHGDTSTSFVAALAAFYNQVKVGHVEAGLRTYDKYSPFPEEMNRQLTGRIADLNFSPTEQNRKNLLKENVSDDIIYKVEKLNDNDWVEIKNHVRHGVRILEDIKQLKDVVELIKYHHEFYNGNGYPAGLSGDAIPLGSRIIAIADAYCALTTDRSYRKAMSVEKALEIMREEASIKWDPMLVDVLINLKCNK